MSDDVTLWCQQLGDAATREQAAKLIWTRYLGSLAVLVRQRLSSQLQSRVDASDIIQNVWNSFFGGRFHLADRNELWNLLATMAANKAIDAARHHTAERRDVRREVVAEFGVMEEVPVRRPAAAASERRRDEVGPSDEGGADEVVVCHAADTDIRVSVPLETLRSLVQDATPEDAALVIELLECLPEELQRIVSYRLQGMTVAQIAHELNCSTRMVNRRIKLIRHKLDNVSREEESEAM